MQDRGRIGLEIHFTTREQDMGQNQAEIVASRALEQVESAIDLLVDYLTYPAISCQPQNADDVRALARRICSDLGALGLDGAQVLELEGALPIVCAEWMHAGADKPTVLIYGHLDLQPVDEPEWRTDPHAAVRVGDRLYARGAADDMGGWVSHIAAIRAWFEETGSLPCNIRLVLEGEEEIGSPNLERFMDSHPECFEADVMVLTDCENPSTEVPGLTVSLRGLMELELRCEALEADVHSGLWGNMVPDVTMVLFKLIARLVDEDGRMQIGRVDVPEEWSKAAWDVPLDAGVIRKGGHITEGIQPLPDRGRPPAEWLWRQPAVTVVSTTMPTFDQKKNALRRHASAILSIRIAPGQTADEMRALLEGQLLENVPGGVHVTLGESLASGESWLYVPKGPAFAAADRAYRKAWGHSLVQVGVGGSIPFVALFGRRFSSLPLILNGVMDPETTAHGPNESLHLGIFQKAILANVHLLDELGSLGREGLKG
jgi:cysteinylglycine-S-conjugate dipeptidase